VDADGVFAAAGVAAGEHHGHGDFPGPGSLEDQPVAPPPAFPA
jgi:hypothetical protein